MIQSITISEKIKSGGGKIEFAGERAEYLSDWAAANTSIAANVWWWLWLPPGPDPATHITGSYLSVYSTVCQYYSFPATMAGILEKKTIFPENDHSNKILLSNYY